MTKNLGAYSDPGETPSPISNPVSSTSLRSGAGLPYVGDNLAFSFAVENKGTSSLEG